MLKQVKKDSILKILRKYEFEPAHAEQVRYLSLLIFDETKEQIHNMGERERELLEAGSILHDIGYYIEAKKHNKNAYKLIMQENPIGFSQEEVEIIANIARYHRGKKPRLKHNCFKNLSPENKELVRRLGGIVKLADSLDRSHLKVVQDIKCNFDFFTRSLLIGLKLNTPDCSVEIRKAKDKKDLFEETFKLVVRFQVL